MDSETRTLYKGIEPGDQKMIRFISTYLILLMGLSLLSSCKSADTLVRTDREHEHLLGGTGKMEKATFAAGCFWGVEEAFRNVDGVVSTAVGYTGGAMEDPNYRDVCTGSTGHAEAVLVEFDPARVPYDKLLEVFWTVHDPTTLNRQGPDVGSQYRSAVFYHDDQQKSSATASKDKLRSSGKYRRDIVTEVTPASTFYMAEDYHQQYLAKRGLAGCGIK